MRKPLIDISQLKMQIFKANVDIVDAPVCELCYLAALIDGEGSLDFSRLSPRIRIGMESLLPFELTKKYGGSVTKYYRKGKVEYTWNVSRRSLLQKIVVSILPHSKIKKRQLGLMLKAIDILDRKPPKWKEHVKKIKEEIKRLNKLSPPDIPLEQDK